MTLQIIFCSTTTYIPLLSVSIFTFYSWRYTCQLQWGWT